jgi:hypothetical protein
VRPAELVIAGAHLSALTSGMLGWADTEGRRDLEECLAEAFDALPSGGVPPVAAFDSAERIRRSRPRASESPADVQVLRARQGRLDP